MVVVVLEIVIVPIDLLKVDLVVEVEVVVKKHLPIHQEMEWMDLDRVVLVVMLCST